MIKLNLETKTKEHELIKTYLEENASQMLADKINNGTPFEKEGKTLINKKTLESFMKYASDEARKLASKGANSACVEDRVVYGWAVHYFEEDTIEGALYEQDGTEYKPQPKSAVKETIKKLDKKPKDSEQISFFDFSGKNLDDSPTQDQEESKEPEDEDMPSEEEIQEIMDELHNEDNQNHMGKVQQTREQKKPADSPLWKKYTEIQDTYPNAVVAMRLGDFYEIFGKKAINIANELDLTLTSRDCGLENRVPMIGFPYHASDIYFTKILSNGHTLAVVETNGTIRALPDKINIDLETGEIYEDITKEEIHKVDGNIKRLENEQKDSNTSAFEEIALKKLKNILGKNSIRR